MSPTSSPAHSSLPPLSAGRKLGDQFEIDGVLGEGGTGIVYDARRAGGPEGERVALKVIHQHLAGDPQIRGRFTREAAILRRLEGDCVCPVLEFGELPDPRREGVGLLYLVLAKVDGVALEAELKKGPMLIDRVCGVMLDVCEALSQAHAQGVIHRDLKPGNVLLRKGGRAVVVDFGMAKIITGGGMGTTALTQHNMVFGTPEYMAPEQARGDELDARCDVYAAGVILYEALTGHVPFSGRSPLNVLTAHLTEPPQKPTARAPDRGISPALEALVLHALAKDPSARYPTAAALAAAIRAAQSNPEDGDAVHPPKRHHVHVNTRDALGITMPSSMEPLVLPALKQRPSAASQSSAPAAARPAMSWPWLVVCAVAAVAGIVLGAWLSTGR